MRAVEHHVQDASELYVVARLQELAEEDRRALSASSVDRWAEFDQYITARGISRAEFSQGAWSVYAANAEQHVPDFYARLTQAYPDERFDFMSVEVRYRNENKKGDFVILLSNGDEIPVSLKNYRGDMRRPQVCSGTYNSFVVNFLFEADGVGMAIDPETGLRFRGSGSERDSVFERNGYGDVVPLLHELDDLNQDIKDRFVYGDDFEFLDPDVFKEAAVACGMRGVDIVLEILQHVPEDAIRDRILRMTGLDGDEEHLFFDPLRCTDSITNERYHQLLTDVQDPDTQLEFFQHGQGIRFQFRRDEEIVLQLDVPFTINKNGAWISESYEGRRYHAKEGVELAYGQRRPRKSKELATSVNTWVNLEATGIFADA